MFQNVEKTKDTWSIYTSTSSLGDVVLVVVVSSVYYSGDILLYLISVYFIKGLISSTHHQKAPWMKVLYNRIPTPHACIHGRREGQRKPSVL